MSDPLLDPVRHNVWGMREILRVCRPLSREQLVAPAPAAYGGVLETLNHLVTSDRNYVALLLHEAKAEWTDTDEFDLFAERMDEAEALWERLLAEGFDAEEIQILDDGAYRSPAGVMFAQALHHGTLHREQICAQLTAFGIEAPDLQPWTYAEMTGRAQTE